MRIPFLSELNAIPKPSHVKGNRWGYCGIAAMSAAIGVSPLAVHVSIPGWPGYTPSKMVIKTLGDFGYNCKRKLVPKNEQRFWPVFKSLYPARIALGRIYYGGGKYAVSHWIVFWWTEDGYDEPLLYDNAFREERLSDTRQINFYDEPVKLKSLYFIDNNGK